MSSERNVLQHERLQNDVDFSANLNCALPSEKIDCFLTMPPEMFIKICKHLDLLSLFKCGAVNRYWYVMTRDPTIVCDISEQYEYKKQILFLKTLIQRCTRVKKFEFDFSDIDSYCINSISCTSTSHKKLFGGVCHDCLERRTANLLKTLTEFFQNCCQKLTHLKLYGSINSHYTDFDCIVQCYNSLNLNKLKSIDLSRQVVTEEHLTELLHCNPDLECLKLEDCSDGTSLGSLLATIGRSNKKMSSLDIHPGTIRSYSHIRWSFAASGLLSQGKRKRCDEETLIECLNLKILKITEFEFPDYEKLSDILYNLTNLTNLVLIYKPNSLTKLVNEAYLEYLKNQSNDFCKKVFKILPKLQELKVSANLIPASELNRLEKLYPKLHIIMREPTPL